MKSRIRKVIACAAAAALICAFLLSGALASGGQPAAEELCAVYLGVHCYGSGEVWKESIPTFLYRFFASGEERLLSVAPDGYEIQNRLQEGAAYRLHVVNDTVTAAEKLAPEQLTEAVAAEAAGCWRASPTAGGASMTEAVPEAGIPAVLAEDGNVYLVEGAPSYTPPVSGDPGVKTLKNLLRTAMAPVGAALYVSGGGHNWQNEGSGPQAACLGLPEEWIAFFRAQDESYAYMSEDPAHSYYPYGGWNEYYYAGVDSAGYLFWTLNNTFGGELLPFDGALSELLEKAGWSLSAAEDGAKRAVLPGDVVISGDYAGLSLGTCEDGSALLLLSAPIYSRSGQAGGGVQLAAVGTDTNCQAYRLADRYMTFYFQDWNERYETALLDPAMFQPSPNEGPVCYSLPISAEGGMSDPDGYAAMEPKQLLQALFQGLPQPPEYSFGEPAAECAPVSPSWFDDAVFIGDSVTVRLKQLCDETHPLGNAQFLCEGSLSATNALWEISSESVHPIYNGAKTKLEDGVAACGAKNVYIMLGINNISFGIENAAGDMLTEILRIQEKSPNINIIIESVTPMTSTSSITSGSLNNDRINEYNAKMRELCSEYGWYFVDVAERFCNEEGYLSPEYCSDTYGMGIHFNGEAAQAWVDYLLTHVPEPLM